MEAVKEKDSPEYGRCTSGEYARPQPCASQRDARP